MIVRRFVELNAAGVVEHDLEVHRQSWDGVKIPLALIATTGHPQGGGIASAIGWVRQLDGTFIAPPPTPNPSPSPIEERLGRVEDLVKRIATKVGA